MTEENKECSWEFGSSFPIRFASGQGMKWIKCSEMMPEIGQKVIIPMKYERCGEGILSQYVTGAIYLDLIKDKHMFWNPSRTLSFHDVCYWMPLPEPPQD